MTSVEELKEVPRRIPALLKVTVQEGGKTPMLSYQELYDMGYKLISYSSLLQRAQIKSGLDVLEVLKREGTTLSVYPERICDHIARSELLGMAQFYELEERLYGPLLDTEGSQRQELRACSRAQATSAKDLPL